MTNSRSLANLRPEFEPWNEVAISHGAYARLRLSEAAGETAAVVRGLVPLQHDADTAAIEVFAFTLEQLRAAASALEKASENGRRENCSA